LLCWQAQAIFLSLTLSWFLSRLRRHSNCPHEYLVESFPSAAAGYQRDNKFIPIPAVIGVGKMEPWHAHFPHLEVRSHFNLTLNTSSVRQGSWTQNNSTRTLIASLQLQQVQTLRTMHLTLGAFSLALVLLTVHRIISDARRAADLQVLPRKK
jgi:hypothetical protein